MLTMFTVIRLDWEISNTHDNYVRHIGLTPDNNIVPMSGEKE